MLRLLGRRLLQAVPMLFILSIGFFALVNLAPGGPLAGQSGARQPRPGQAARLNRQFGLDQPLPAQYVTWLLGNDWQWVDADGDGFKESRGVRRGILRGDFGVSFRSRQPVLSEIGQRLPNTLYLMGITLGVVALLAVPLGVLAAVRRYTKLDWLITSLSFVGQAIPDFWLGLILILVFYGWLKNPVSGAPLLPSGGMGTLDAPFAVGDRLKHLVLPVTMGAVGWVAWYSRFLRAGMLDVIGQDYMRTARAKGLSERQALFRHALKNALIPLITIFALDVPYIFAGSLYTELLFAWPGMGRLYYQAALDRDYPLLLAILILGTIIVIGANLLADLAYSWLDPRIHYE